MTFSGRQLPSEAFRPAPSPTAAVVALGFAGPFTVQLSTGWVLETRGSIELARLHVSRVPGGYTVDVAEVTVCSFLGVSSHVDQ